MTAASEARERMRIEDTKQPDDERALESYWRLSKQKLTKAELALTAKLMLGCSLVVAEGVANMVIERLLSLGEVDAWVAVPRSGVFYKWRDRSHG